MKPINRTPTATVRSSTAAAVEAALARCVSPIDAEEARRWDDEMARRGIATAA